MKQNNPSLRGLLDQGIRRENPVLVQLLGMCPTLAVTTMAENGLGMGLATTAVLACSNLVISLLQNIIPDKVRIPCYIVVIAGFVTALGFLMQAYLPALYDALGLFFPLIVVNCIVLGRAEQFASKNRLLPSLFDGLGMGLGFTAALFLMGSIREILGSGTWLSIQLFPEALPPMTFFVLAPGGFFVLGCLIALYNKFLKGRPAKQDFGCENCAAPCASPGKGGCKA